MFYFSFVAKLLDSLNGDNHIITIIDLETALYIFNNSFIQDNLTKTTFVMKKTILILVFLSTCQFSWAQQDLNNYKYVIVPKHFDFPL